MEELFNEIKRRHDGVLIVTIADAKNDEAMEQFGIYLKGGLMLAIGMADFALVRSRSLLHTPTDDEGK